MARRMKLTTASARGDRLAELTAMRQILAAAIEDENTPPRDLAALTRRLIDLGEEVEKLTAVGEERASHVSEDSGTVVPLRAEAI